MRVVNLSLPKLSIGLRLSHSHLALIFDFHQQAYSLMEQNHPIASVSDKRRTLELRIVPNLENCLDL